MTSLTMTEPSFLEEEFCNWTMIMETRCNGDPSIKIINCTFMNEDVINNPLSAFKLTKIILTAVVFLWSLVVNILVIAIVHYNDSLKTPMNIYLVNLAVADLLITIVCFWENALRDYSYVYLMGPIMCKFGGVVQSKYFIYFGYRLQYHWVINHP